MRGRRLAGALVGAVVLVSGTAVAYSALNGPDTPFRNSAPEARTELAVHEAPRMLADQTVFERLLVHWRRDYRGQLGSYRIEQDPPAYTVSFVGGVPSKVHEDVAAADLLHPVHFVVSEGPSVDELARLQRRIARVLSTSEQVEETATALDEAAGAVRVWLPGNFVIEGELAALLDSPYVVVRQGGSGPMGVEE